MSLVSWFKVPATKIDELPPGTLVLIDGTTFIRMEDDIPRHVTGCIFNPVTGNWSHWSRLIVFTKEVDIEYSEKVVYPYKSPAHQNWKITLYIPDNLPKQHTLADLRSPRKSIKKAFDDFIEQLLD